MSDPTPAERRRARTRADLMASALRRFEQYGYESTTVPEIAGDADISTRTFFRYFVDKEDVLFPDNRELYRIAERSIRGSGEDVRSAFYVILAALTQVAAVIETSRDRLQARARVIARTPALRGREQVKYLEWQDELLPLLTDLKYPADDSRLAMNLAFGVWREAYRRWLEDPGSTSLSEHLAVVRRDSATLMLPKS